MRKIFAILLPVLFNFSGIAQNIVSSLKDNQGNLWFSVAERGVFRYDGTSFINFTKEKNTQNIRVSSCLYADKIGNLWFNTNEGLCYYDGTKFNIFKIPFPPAALLGAEKYANLVRSPIQVLEILQDTHGRYWFLTMDHGVYRYDKKLSDTLRDETSFANFLLNETPNCILENRAGDIFIGSWRGGGVYRYNNKSLSAGQEGFSKVSGFHDGMISYLVEDRTGTIWAGTRNASVDRYDGKSVTNYSQKDGLTDDCIYCLLEDSKGNIWLGSEGQKKTKRGDAFIYDGKSFINMTAQVPATMAEGYVFGVRSLVEDKTGSIWIGSYNGLLLCYNGRKFINYSEMLFN